MTTNEVRNVIKSHLKSTLAPATGSFFTCDVAVSVPIDSERHYHRWKIRLIYGRREYQQSICLLNRSLVHVSERDVKELAENAAENLREELHSSSTPHGKGRVHEHIGVH